MKQIASVFLLFNDYSSANKSCTRPCRHGETLPTWGHQGNLEGDPYRRMEDQARQKYGMGWDGIGWDEENM